MADPLFKVEAEVEVAVYPFYGELRKTEEEQQYKTPINLCYLIAQIKSGLISVVTW